MGAVGTCFTGAVVDGSCGGCWTCLVSGGKPSSILKCCLPFQGGWDEPEDPRPEDLPKPSASFSAHGCECPGFILPTLAL